MDIGGGGRVALRAREIVAALALLALGSLVAVAVPAVPSQERVISVERPAALDSSPSIAYSDLAEDGLGTPKSALVLTTQSAPGECVLVAGRHEHASVRAERLADTGVDRVRSDDLRNRSTPRSRVRPVAVDQAASVPA